MKRIALILAVVSLWHARPAEACGNSMYDERRLDPKQQLLVEGKQHLAAGRFRPAAASAERLLKLAAKESTAAHWAHRIAGLGYLRSGEARKALPHLRMAVDAFPDQFELKVRLGQAEIGSGRLSEGKRRLEELSTDPLFDANAWVALSEARLLTNDRTGAAKATEEALKLNPKHSEALAQKAKLAS